LQPKLGAGIGARISTAVLKLNFKLRFRISAGIGARIGAVSCILNLKLHFRISAIVGAVAGLISPKSDPQLLLRLKFKILS
jgi:hypothetical protein